MVDLRRALFKGGATDERTSSRGSNASGSQYHHVHEANAAAINDDEHKNEGGAAVEDESRASPFAVRLCTRCTRRLTASSILSCSPRPAVRLVLRHLPQPVDDGASPPFLRSEAASSDGLTSSLPPSPQIGTGVFSTPGSLLKSLGSVGLVLICGCRRSAARNPFARG